MNDCNNCLHRINETCYLIRPQFDCDQFVQFDFPEHQPPDNSFRSKPDRGEYEYENDTECASISAPPPVPNSSIRLRKGQTLFYRDRNTGRIEKGRVKWSGKRRFLFSFDCREVWLDLAVIGTRLFYTHEGAEKLAPRKPNR